MNDHETQKSSTIGSHETRDVNVRRIALIVTTLLIICAIAMLAADFYLRLVTSYRQASAPRAPEGFPQPQLQKIPAAELQQLQSRFHRELTTYGWIDPGRGSVRIPVERAMELLVQRGLPETKTGVTRLQMQQQKAMKPKEAPNAEYR
jgi:hypothetical protein